MDLEEDIYSIIFSALKHPSRRKIIRILAESPNTYTELQKKLGVETGFLNYYLESLDGLVIKDRDGKYRISDLGRSAVDLIRQVEEPPRKIKPENKIELLGFRVSIAYIVLVLVVMLVFSNGYWVYAFQRQSNEKTNLLGENIINAKVLLMESVEIINVTLKESRISFHSWYHLLDYTTRISNNFKMARSLDTGHYSSWLQLEQATEKLAGFISDVLERHSLKFPFMNLTYGKGWIVTLTKIMEDLVELYNIMPSNVTLGTAPYIGIDDEFSTKASTIGFKLQKNIDSARRTLSIPETLIEPF
ncbi:winged helix-turn-helix transcriptional regulator [Candidatus Bathyarchaeota archaeon]|nr:winged helix-turn-helix transcriptional regulator [Candidatus Bathyarchaeota archaeon]